MGALGVYPVRYDTMDLITADMYYLTEQDENVVIRRLAIEQLEAAGRGRCTPGRAPGSTPRRRVRGVVRRHAGIRIGRLRGYPLPV